MDLPGLDPGGADQLVDIDRARPKGRHDQFAFGLADVGQRLGRPVLIGGGKLGRRRKRRTSQDRREAASSVQFVHPTSDRSATANSRTTADLSFDEVRAGLSFKF